MVLLLGLLSQFLFGVRLLVQLWYTTRFKSTAVPFSYWLISLWAALFYFSYGVLRNDIVIVLGQLITYFIYIRNVQLQGKWSVLPIPGRIFYMVMPIVMFIWFVLTAETLELRNLNNPILLAGFLGQLMMNLRFIIQWLYAERVNNASFPGFFWCVSIVGSLMLMVYGLWHPLHGFDPVIILSQLLAMTVYVRSLYLQRRDHSVKVFQK